MGYGFALQAYCLEGFDSLGLHQFYGLHVLAGKYAVGHSPSEALVQFQRSPPIISLKCYLVASAVWGRVVLVRIQVGRPVFALVSLVVEVLFCNQGVEVRFLPGAPIMSLSSNGRTLIKGYPVKDTVSNLQHSMSRKRSRFESWQRHQVKDVNSKFYTLDF